jgi:hypothetical protein
VIRWARSAATSARRSIGERATDVLDGASRFSAVSSLVSLNRDIAVSAASKMRSTLSHARAAVGEPASSAAPIVRRSAEPIARDAKVVAGSGGREPLSTTSTFGPLRITARTRLSWP